MHLAFFGSVLAVQYSLAVILPTQRDRLEKRCDKPQPCECTGNCPVLAPLPSSIPPSSAPASTVTHTTTQTAVDRHAKCFDEYNKPHRRNKKARAAASGGVGPAGPAGPQGPQGPQGVPGQNAVGAGHAAPNIGGGSGAYPQQAIRDGAAITGQVAPQGQAPIAQPNALDSDWLNDHVRRSFFDSLCKSERVQVRIYYAYGAEDALRFLLHVIENPHHHQAQVWGPVVPHRRGVAAANPHVAPYVANEEIWAPYARWYRQHHYPNHDQEGHDIDPATGAAYTAPAGHRTHPVNYLEVITEYAYQHFGRTYSDNEYIAQNQWEYYARGVEKIVQLAYAHSAGPWRDIAGNDIHATDLARAEAVVLQLVQRWRAHVQASAVAGDAQLLDIPANDINHFRPRYRPPFGAAAGGRAAPGGAPRAQIHRSRGTSRCTIM